MILDPVTNFRTVGSQEEAQSMLTRLLDLLKWKGITVLCTSLTGGGDSEQQSEAGISSLMDTWLLVRNLESGGERNRGLYILKSRGMAHSNQVREFVFCDQGIKLIEPYVGMGTVLTGSARAAQEARERADAVTAEEIIAVPTLVKLMPSPLRKLIGDMSKTEKVLMGLGISSPKG